MDTKYRIFLHRISQLRSGVVGGLQGQTEAVWDAAGDLREEVGEERFKQGATWDVRLALAVFEAKMLFFIVIHHLRMMS